MTAPGIITAHALERLAERAGITDPEWLARAIETGWRWRQDILDRGQPCMLVPLRGGTWALLRDGSVVTVLTDCMRRNNHAWGRYVLVDSPGHESPGRASPGDVADDGQDTELRHERAASRVAWLRSAWARLCRREFSLTGA